MSDHPTLDYLTDPARTFPIIGDYDPSKKSAAAQVKDCKAAGLPDFWCEGRSPDLGDIPLVAWGVIGVGAALFAALGWTIYQGGKIVVPVAAPYARAAARQAIARHLPSMEDIVGREAAPHLRAMRRAKDTQAKQAAFKAWLDQHLDARGMSPDDFIATQHIGA